MGGVRTALFNYLFARRNKGTMILRIEDTDQNRYVPGAEEYIMESLKWCGIEIDEGVKEGGEFGPYKQSERKETYLKFANQLIDEGKAYYAFDTPEELDAMRKRLKESCADNLVYDSLSRSTIDRQLTSATLPSRSSRARLSSSFSRGVLRTHSGWSAISSRVPSTSRKRAQLLFQHGSVSLTAMRAP